MSHDPRTPLGLVSRDEPPVSLDRWQAAGARDADWAALLDDADPVIRARVARNPDAPDSHVARLAGDPAWFVRWAAVRRPVVDAPGSDSRHAWSIGETGPAGGVVFFDAGERRWWGRYLEAAPAGWAVGDGLPGTGGAPASGRGADAFAPWCPEAVAHIEVATGLGIGWGMWNTWRIVQVAGRSSAAWRAATYRGGGALDWFLPSKSELAALYDARHLIGEVTADSLWSSSQSRSFATFAWNQASTSAVRSFVPKVFACRVHPVRAFAPADTDERGR